MEFEHFTLLRENRPVGVLKGKVQVFDGSEGHKGAAAEESRRLEARRQPVSKSPTSTPTLFRRRRGRCTSSPHHTRSVVLVPPDCAVAASFDFRSS